MQPFLMLKQTLEAPFDPGPLLLYGPNVKLTDQEQALSHGRARNDNVQQFTIGLKRGANTEQLTFRRSDYGFKIALDRRTSGSVAVNLFENPTKNQLEALYKALNKQVERSLSSFPESLKKGSKPQLKTERNRCFIEPVFSVEIDDFSMQVPMFLDHDFDFAVGSERWSSLLRGLIHVPGLRGNPERSYQRTAVGNVYRGTFETYVASIVHDWTNPKNAASEKAGEEKMADLTLDLQRLELTWKVQAKRVDDASIELTVGRLPHAQQGGAHDLVSVADVGFGVSQTLPVLVALHAASRGQIVYIEQPEIHLHPRAQVALAHTFAAAAMRGVNLIVETHSALLVRSLQTLVADQSIPASFLSMNWFGRDSDTGISTVTKVEIDRNGRLGDWPVDFDEVAQEADWAFLTALSRSS